MISRPLTPQFSQITVTIDEVDVTTRTVHAHDKTNAPIQAAFRTAPGATLRIPAQGDLWTCQRIGYQWYLNERIDTVDEHTYANDSMTPGDSRLAADGTLHVVADEILFNGSALGVTTYERFSPDGTTTAFTLSTNPIAMSIQAFINGLLIDPTTFTLAVKTLTFATPPASGSLIVYYQGAVPPKRALMTSTSLLTSTDLLTSS